MFHAALILYFVLLASFIPFAIGKDSISFEIFISGIDALIIVIFCLRFRKAIRPVLNLASWRWWIFPIPVTVALCVLDNLYIGALVNYANIPYAGLRISDYQEFGLGWVGIFMLICLQPGIFEELAFRGVIVSGLSGHLSERETGALSTFMFALLHLSLWNFPGLLLVGYGLFYLRAKSGSIVPGMAMHMLYNLVCIVWEHNFPIISVSG